MNPAIGHSTGWFSAKVSVDLEFHSAALARSGASAVEIVEGPEERLRAFEVGTLPAKLRYASIHLGDFRETSPEVLEQRVGRIHQIVERLGLQGASLHPDLASNEALAKLTEAGVTFGIENMDREKRFGKTVRDMLSLPSQAPFVVDLQHAYENLHDDPQAFKSLIQELCSSGREVLHLHVSGEHSSSPALNHMPLHLATNGREVFALLRELVDHLQFIPPTILEGDYLFDREYLAGPISDKKRDTLIDLAAKRMTDEIDWIKAEILNW